MSLMKIDPFFKNWPPVELKIAKSETFDLFIVTGKLYITDMQNYTFSKTLCQEECISKGFLNMRSNSKFDPCVTLQESKLLFELPKILPPKIFG